MFNQGGKKAALLILVLISVFSFSSSAQKSDVGNWFIYFGNQAINKKWNWHNEVQYRNYNFAGDLEQLMLRTGIGYNLTENNNNLLLGYGFIRGQRYIKPDSSVYSSEHRIFQQYITRQQFGRFYVQHRYRVEERFLPDDFKVRFRYFLALNLPLNKKTMTRNAVYLSLYNELFINAESPVFDRNRIYGAMGFVINKYIRAEAGFMSQVLEKTRRNQFQIVVFNNLPFN